VAYANKYKFLPNVPTHDVDMAHEFLHLTDTPATFSGSGTKLVRVNTQENSIEFVSPSEVPASIYVEDEHSSIDNTPHITLNFVGPGVSAVDAGSGVAEINIPGRSEDDVFGFSFSEESSENESYTNSTSYVQKLRMSVDVPDGDYRIGWYYEWSQENSNWRFYGKVELDDSIGLAEIKVRPSESSWNHWHATSGFDYQTLSSGTHTIDIDYKTSKWNKTAGIRKARIEFWRVS